MLGDLGKLTHLLRNAGQIKENMKQMQERLAAARFIGDAGGGQAQATVDGKGDLISVKLEPTLLEAGDKELVEELVVASIRDAVAKSREAAQRELQQATGGMDLGGMMDMFGGKP